MGQPPSAGTRVVAESTKANLRAFIDQSVSMAVAGGVPLSELRGIASYNPIRDARFTPLEAFAGATQAVINIPGLAEKFGAEAGSLIVLQFVYQYFSRVDSVRYEETVLESLWLDFIAEVNEPNWTTRAVANVRFFNSENLLIDLGDGIAIRGRSPEDLGSLGFGTPVWDRIADDWSGFGASSFVLVVEHSRPKQPNNLTELDSYPLSVKAMRAVQALRLAAAGSVGIGPMWVVRAARFNAGIGGLVRIGASIPTTGAPYSWTAIVEQAYPPIYHALKLLDENKWYGRSPGNLEIAIRAFMAIYDSWPNLPDWQLLNCITALEALLGTESEISFRLAFRIAGLLAANDNERTNLFELMREFYDTRSRLVHGGELNDKHRQRLQRLDELIAIARRLVRSFVGFAAAPPSGYSKKLFAQLDTKLSDANEREKLRAILNLR
jgi:hypothetical protein